MEEPIDEEKTSTPAPLKPTQLDETYTPPAKKVGISKKLLIIIGVLVIVLASFFVICKIKNSCPYNSTLDNILNSNPVTEGVYITAKDLEQGWYYGSINQRKLGTPENWLHTGEGTKNAMWIKPEEESNNIPSTETGYITDNDLKTGWYYGNYDQKKPGTPDNWIHKGEGTRSAMWLDPDKYPDTEEGNADLIKKCRELVNNVKCDPPGSTCMTNPASSFCICMGGELEMREREGVQFGICIFDNQEIEEWDYYRNTAGVYMKD